MGWRRSGATAESIKEDPAAAGRLPEDLAGQLVAAAKAQGPALTGPGELLTGLTKQVSAYDLRSPGGYDLMSSVSAR